MTLIFIGCLVSVLIVNSFKFESYLSIIKINKMGGKKKGAKKGKGGDDDKYDPA